LASSALSRSVRAWLFGQARAITPFGMHDNLMIA
jgi:hypothetical protein